jgi:hypothetical protein
MRHAPLLGANSRMVGKRVGHLETWRLWRDLAAQGVALGTGLPEAADHFPEGLGIPPGEEPCRYCELTSLCRVTEEAH